jgi:hypothetical protein
MKNISIACNMKIEGTDFFFQTTLFAAVDVESNECGNIVTIAAISTYKLNVSNKEDYLYLKTERSNINRIDEIREKVGFDRPIFDLIEFEVNEQIRTEVLHINDDVTEYDLSY